MPKLRTDPRLSGGIRLHSSGRAARLKWLSVLGLMVVATALESLPVSEFGRIALEELALGAANAAVAVKADAGGSHNDTSADVLVPHVSSKAHIHRTHVAALVMNASVHKYPVCLPTQIR